MKNIKKLLIAFALMIVTITHSFAVICSSSLSTRAVQFNYGELAISAVCYDGIHYKDLANLIRTKGEILYNNSLECSFSNRAKFVESIIKNSNINIIKTIDNAQTEENVNLFIKMANEDGLAADLGDVVVILVDSNEPQYGDKYLKLLMVAYIENATDGIMYGEPYDYICKFASRHYICDRP